MEAPPEPPGGGNDPIDQEQLQLPNRDEIGPETAAKVHQLLLDLTEEEHLAAQEPVAERVEAGDGLPAGCPRAGAHEGVAPVRGDPSVTQFPFHG